MSGNSLRTAQTIVVLSACITGTSFIAWPTNVLANQGIAASVGWTSSLMGQGNSETDAGRRREADKWLRQARQAMKENNLETAKYNLERAEKLNAKYDSVMARLSDTPEKVRKDLAAAESKAGKVNAVRGQSPRGESSGKPNAPPADPYALPAGSTVERMSGDAKSRARDFLVRGRESLRAGDIPAAIHWQQKSLATGAEFFQGEFSPREFEQELLRAGVTPNLLSPPARLGEREPAAPGTLAPSSIDRFAGEIPRSSNRPGAPAAFEPPPSGLRRLPSVNSSNASSKEEALRLAARARAALDRGDLNGARDMAQQAQSLNIPDSAFNPGELRPWQVLLEVESSIQRRGGVRPAAMSEPYVGNANDRGNYPVSQGLYLPSNDRSRVTAANAQEPTLANRGAGEISRGVELYQQGLRALEQQDTESAVRLFSEAWRFESEIDTQTRQQLRDKLTLLRAASQTSPRDTREPSTFDEPIIAQQQLIRSKLFREVTSEQAAAQKQSENDPKGALDRMQLMRSKVAQADLDQVSRNQITGMVDRSIKELERFINDNRSEIELRDRNDAILKEIDTGREKTWDMQNQLAKLVEDFNKLMDEGRFAEAEVLAKQANELDPDSSVVQNMNWKSKFAHRFSAQQSTRSRSEEGYWAALQSVQESAEPFDDRNPIDFGGAKRWTELTSGRQKRFMEQQGKRLTPTEVEIRKALREKKVEVHFTNQPLAEVIDSLIQLTGVNVHLDPQGLAAEGITSDTPVTINLQQPITLQSALNLILEPLRLSYVIKNEVLQITSEQTRDANTYTVTYYVADLVTPIPNFLPDYNIGLPGAIQEAHRNLGYGGGPQWYGSGVPMVNPETGAGSAPNRNVLAQMMSTSGELNRKASGMSSRVPRIAGGSPGGLGGAALADFTQLIELITTTIDPDSWTDNGGPGAVSEFDTNLSLVVSQTQAVHEQIADLLEQLRRLQDLQVTIEVRFMILRDDFFERVGVDFDFNIEDNAPRRRPAEDSGPSTVVGLDPTGNFTQDLDLQFTQDNFGVAVPPFGGFSPANAANFGFAILSDIEVFFLLQAAQGDTRSNVLQAPKVTLFNGQLATVFDGATRPFVTGLIPVVGDFAAAHQPVVAVVHEGTSLSVQAVVSSDRRFVRLTLVPYFSHISDVKEFTFTGRRTSNSGTSVTDPAGEPTGDKDNVSSTTEGTTVQLPTVSQTIISTTVSVPDGGTILLGGIKRLSEGRNEAGVPMLSKIPYVSRLFRNVGIGRTTNSLMMMVTPRIIIQEEEEEKMGIRTTP